MAKIIAALLRHLIEQYQRLLSPLMGRRCRFYPTCSDYARRTLEADALLRALAKIAWRLARCNPMNPGGIDYP